VASETRPAPNQPTEDASGGMTFAERPGSCPGSIPDPGNPVAVGCVLTAIKFVRPTYPSHRHRPPRQHGRPPHQCGGLPLCGEFPYAYDAKTSAKRKSSALPASTGTPGTAAPRHRRSRTGAPPARHPRSRTRTRYRPRYPADRSPHRRREVLHPRWSTSMPAGTRRGESCAVTPDREVISEKWVAE
jgi:hypothetical protein